MTRPTNFADTPATLLIGGFVLLCTASIVPLAAAEVFIVDTTVDQLDGSCADDCSLRDAVALANIDADLDEIVLSAATYELNLVGTGDDAGDLDVLNPVLIRGVDAEQTIVQQVVPDERVLQISTTSPSDLVQLQNLSVAGGSATDTGGGIHTSSALELSGVTVRDNFADQTGGGLFIANDAAISIIEGLFEDNSSDLSGFHIGGAASEFLLDLSTISSGSGFGAMVLSLNQGMLRINSSTIDSGSVGFVQLSFFLAELEIRNSTLASPLSATSTGDPSNASIIRSSVVSDGDFIAALQLDLESKIEGTLIDGECAPGTSTNVTSLGNNVHTYDNCFAPQPSDQVLVDPADLFLGPLQDNGGPTDTFPIQDDSSLLAGSGDGLCPRSLDQRGTFRNQCDIGSFERETACFQPAIPLAIPDDDSTGVGFTIDGALLLGTAIEVLVDIVHPSVGDLSMVLEGPQGQQVTLLDRPIAGTCSGSNVLTFFSDQTQFDADTDCRSINGLEAFPNSRYSPSGNLSSLDLAEGTWGATVSDSASGNTGSIRRVCLISKLSIFSDGFESGDLMSWSSASR